MSNMSICIIMVLPMIGLLLLMYYFIKFLLKNTSFSIDDGSTTEGAIIIFIVIFSIFANVFTCEIQKVKENIEVLDENNESYKIYENTLVYYVESNEGITTKKVDLGSDCSLSNACVLENYVLDKNEQPYISYHIHKNILGLELYKNDFELYLFKR